MVIFEVKCSKMSDVEQVEEEIDIGADENDTIFNSNRCVHLTLRIVFSTPGLVLLVVLYSIMGALIFPLLEAPAEIQNTLSVTRSRDECLKELWTITGKQMFPNTVFFLELACLFTGNCFQPN